MREQGGPASGEKIIDDVRSYVDMRIASVKLAMVEGLSRLAGNALRIVIFLLLCTIALLVLTAALVSWLATMVGTVALAALMVGIFLLIVGLIVLAAKKLFVNPMVGMFSDMFFKPRKHDYDEDM